MNYFQKIAAQMVDFCDLRLFRMELTRHSKCPISSVTTAGENLTDEEKKDLAKLTTRNHPDAEKIMHALDSHLSSESDSSLKTYGFSHLTLDSIITAIESLQDGSSVKKDIEDFIEKQQETLQNLSDKELLGGWKNIFLKLFDYLKEKYGSASKVSTEKVEMYKGIPHKDDITTYKNEVPGCARHGTCCAKCDRLIDCPVPESICHRVQKWGLIHREDIVEHHTDDLASGETVKPFSKVEEFPGFDPANLRFTKEPIPKDFSKLSPKDQEYFTNVKKRQKEEEKKEKNPYVQRAEELDLEDSFPGIMEWYRAQWDWLLDLADKKIPVLDENGNPTGRIWTFSDKKWQNINAHEIQLWQAGKYPQPSREEFEHYIAKVQGKRTWHSEKAKKMTPTQIFDAISKLPTLEGLGDNLREYYKTETGATGKVEKK